jgi:hypothetical protein
MTSAGSVRASIESNLVPNAGLLPAAVLAQRIDLAGLIDRGCTWPGTVRTAARRR